MQRGGCVGVGVGYGGRGRRRRSEQLAPDRTRQGRPQAPVLGSAEGMVSCVSGILLLLRRRHTVCRVGERSGAWLQA